MEKKPQHVSKGSQPQVAEQRYDLRIVQSLRRIIRAVDIHSRKMVSRHNISGPQLSCLLALKEHGAMTSAKLAQHVFLSPSTIVGIIDRLEEKRLVQRRRDSKDRRLIHIDITAMGEEVVAAAPSSLQDTLRNALGELPESEKVAIAMALDTLVDLLETGDIHGAPAIDTRPLPFDK